MKPVRWVGTALKDLRSCPREVRIEIGHALFAAQEGATDPAAKPLRGFGGASVLEIVASHHGNAWRLHRAFSGCRLRFARVSEEVHERHRDTLRELDLIKRRLLEAERDYKGRQGQK